MKINMESLIEAKSFWESLGKFSGINFREIRISDLESLTKKYPESEPSKLLNILNILPKESLVFVGNSLSIRLMELVHSKKLFFLGNRGVNGIDGQVSTAIGIAKTTSKKVFCILGDLTALYDISAFYDIPDNLCLIIINNKGGKIFETMKLSNQMCMNHERNFESISLAFGKKYSSGSLDSIFDTQILELFPVHEQTLCFLRELE